MKKIILRKASNFILYRTPIGEAYTKIFDIKHHLKYSFKDKSLKEDKSHLKYYLTKHYHIIEKGLALPEPRLGFGQPKILDVIAKTEVYEKLYGIDDLVCSIRKTLIDYMKFNKNEGFVFSENFEKTVNDFLSRSDIVGKGGLKYINKITASTLSLEEFNEFAQGRVSVRDFSNESVPDGLLYSAVEVARSAPSVCNRQGWKVHYYSDKVKIKEILKYQNGNTGFTDVIDKLIIVTADAKAFTSYESNQIFIDGGLFSMNLLLAIHAAGLGSCPLNTCYPSFTEQKVKTVSEIPDNERLIMMIGVGCLKDQYSVAYSPRNPTTDIFTNH